MFVHSWQSTKKYSFVFFPLETYLIVKSFPGALNPSNEWKKAHKITELLFQLMSEPAILNSMQKDLS